MQCRKYVELVWEDKFEPLYGSVVEIPPYSILWRAYDTSYPSISERPTYFSSKETAERYCKGSTYKVSAFMPLHRLRIIDVRFMTTILSRFIQLNHEDEYIDEFTPTMLSFGLCSLRHQIELLKQRYKASATMKHTIAKMEKYYEPTALIEQAGVRVAEATNEGATMAFLREIFSRTFDGFISPRINPELIIFNPKGADIVELPRYPCPVKLYDYIINGTDTLYISDLFRHTYATLNISYLKKEPSIRMTFVCGAVEKDSTATHPLEEYNRLIHTNPAYKESDNEYQKAGIRWHRKINMATLYSPVTANISPFIQEPRGPVDLYEIDPRTT
jgi:hypothetical protein